MVRSRPAAVAELFYPGKAQDLRSQVQGLLDAREGSLRPPLKALIVPHAGYVYSGATAAMAYQELQKDAARIRRVVLLGPGHRVAVNGLVLPSVEAFETPLGAVPIDQEAAAAVKDMPQVLVADEPHAEEHSLEVQLPFLQAVLGEFKLLPFVVGRATPEQVANVLEVIWGGEETLIVISTDLSHYHLEGTARCIDGQTMDAIENYATDLKGEQACGAKPLNGMLLAARRRGLDIERCGFSNSADTIGPPERVVGYGAWMLRPAAGRRSLDDSDHRRLLALAYSSIAFGMEKDHKPLPVRLGDWPARFRVPGATFVTLEIDARLRGCRGSLGAVRSLAEDIAINASDTAYRDPRFPPLTARELKQTDMSLSLLDAPVAFDADDLADLEGKLCPGRDGLIIAAGKHRATFLPSVWEQLSEPRKFIDQLWRKAGLRPGVWPEGIQFQRYGATKVGPLRYT